MANIDKELRAILAAVHGKEVRDSIHDALKAGNEESEKAMNDAAQSAAHAADSLKHLIELKQQVEKIDLPEMREAVKITNENRDSVRANAEKAGISESNAKTSEINAKTSEVNAKASEQKAEYSSKTAKSYADLAEENGNEAVKKIEEALDMKTPGFMMNFQNGHLEYEGGRFDFLVDENNGHLEWEVTI